MKVLLRVPARRGGRRRKPKDVVLGAPVQTSLTHPMYREITAARQAAGCTQPEFLRILIGKGFEVWKADRPSPTSVIDEPDALMDKGTLSTTGEYDATG